MLHFEDTKVSEFQAVAVRKFLHHAVEEKLHDVSNIRTTHSGQISNSIDQLLLRGGAHGDSILGPGGRDRHPRDSAHTNHAVAISVNAKRLSMRAILAVENLLGCGELEVSQRVVC